MRSAIARVGCINPALLACCVAAFALIACPIQAGGPVAIPGYDLTVIIVAPDIGPAQVALSYPKLVDHAALQQAIGALAAKTGASVTDLQIEDGRQGRGLPETGTAAQFSARGLLDPRGSALPVGPIIRSLPEWRHMRLVFMVGEAFRFMGPAEAVADGFSVQLVTRMKPYEYDVERKSGEAAPRSEVAAKQEQVSSALLPAMLVGLPAGFLVGWLLSDVKLKGSPSAGSATRKAPRAGRAPGA